MAATPHLAGESLRDCLDKADAVLGGEAVRHRTGAYLRATAGMRVVHANNVTLSNEILASVTHALNCTGEEMPCRADSVRYDGAMTSASILEGWREGVDGWIGCV